MPVLAWAVLVSRNPGVVDSWTAVMVVGDPHSVLRAMPGPCIAVRGSMWARRAEVYLRGHAYLLSDVAYSVMPRLRMQEARRCLRIRAWPRSYASNKHMQFKPDALASNKHIDKRSP